MCLLIHFTVSHTVYLFSVSYFCSSFSAIVLFSYTIVYIDSFYCVSAYARLNGKQIHCFKYVRAFFFSRIISFFVFSFFFLFHSFFVLEVFWDRFNNICSQCFLLFTILLNKNHLRGQIKFIVSWISNLFCSLLLS